MAEWGALDSADACRDGGFEHADIAKQATTNEIGALIHTLRMRAVSGHRLTEAR